MDLTETIVPKSDQINADDLMAGPRTFTVGDVKAGSAEQPVNIHLVEFPGRPYRPSKSMRRVLVALWGKEAADYAGRRLTLYRDPEVRFGKDKVGGIKISALSHIDKKATIMLTATRGRREPHTVEPLASDAPTSALSEPPAETVANCFDLDELRKMWQATTEGSERRAQIEARVAEVQAAEADK